MSSTNCEASRSCSQKLERSAIFPTLTRADLWGKYHPLDHSQGNAPLNRCPHFYPHHTHPNSKTKQHPIHQKYLVQFKGKHASIAQHHIKIT